MLREPTAKCHRLQCTFKVRDLFEKDELLTEVALTAVLVQASLEKITE